MGMDDRMIETDLHQHLWTEQLVSALARRTEPPFARSAKGRFVVYSPHEGPATVEAGARAVARRLDDLQRDRVGRAVLAISSPIGVECLPRREAEPLLDAFEEGIADLPSPFAAWGPIALEGAGAADVDRVLDAGCVGVSLPAGALATPRRLD